MLFFSERVGNCIKIWGEEQGLVSVVFAITGTVEHFEIMVSFNFNSVSNFLLAHLVDLNQMYY